MKYLHQLIKIILPFIISSVLSLLMFFGLSLTLGIKQESAIYLDTPIDKTEKYLVSYNTKKKEDRALLGNYFSQTAKNRLKKTSIKKITPLKDLAYILDVAEKPVISISKLINEEMEKVTCTGYDCQSEEKNKICKGAGYFSCTLSFVRKTNNKYEKDVTIASDVIKGFARKDTDDDYSTKIIPIVVIVPNYPRKAAIAKIEGWVKLKFTITEGGTVVKSQVMESKPVRIFDREALRAILKYKYKPTIVHGVAYTQTATEIIVFKLDRDE